MTDISIHAVLTDSDLFWEEVTTIILHFNPRCPYGQRLLLLASFFACREFQSTLSLRTATAEKEGIIIMSQYFNPRCPYGQRPVADATRACVYRFQSTLSLRTATFVQLELS